MQHSLSKKSKTNRIKPARCYFKQGKDTYQDISITT